MGVGKWPTGKHMVAGSGGVKGISQGPASPIKYFEADVAVFLVPNSQMGGWMSLSLGWAVEWVP